MDKVKKIASRELRSAIVVCLVFLTGLSGIGSAHSQGRMNIIVEDTARKAVGARLAFAVKERLRKTEGFALVTTRDDALFRFGLVTLDDESGYSTVYSAVFSAWQPETGTWTLLTNFVGTCGASRLTECADGLVADADKAAEVPRNFYKNYTKK